MKSNFPAFFLMHIGFLIYSFYTVIGKFASQHERFSLQFCILYCCVILVLFIYAIIWQQVLKTFRLPIAICNKAMTIVWGMILSALIFSEQITLKKITGAAIILCGIILLSVSDSNTSKTSKEKAE